MTKMLGHKGLNINGASFLLHCVCSPLIVCLVSIWATAIVHPDSDESTPLSLVTEILIFDMLVIQNLACYCFPYSPTVYFHVLTVKPLSDHHPFKS